MWLYLLKQRAKVVKYDRMAAIVVRANGERAARDLAAEFAGDEGAVTWIHDSLSSCKKLTHKGERQVICIDFHEG